jgi:hypothetical protein
MTTCVSGLLDAFAPVGLDELVDRAALLTRVDRKYVVPVADLDRVLAGLLDHARALDIDGRRAFGYASTYVDDAALTSFHQAAQGRRRRFKVRHRTYLDSGLAFVEVKTRGVRGTTVKQRVPLSSGADHFVDRVLSEAGFGVRAVDLRPVLTTAYRRSTLLLPASRARVTVDTDLTWHLPDGPGLELPDLAIVETKSGSAASAADRHLWAQGYRPCRLSKYGTGLAALEPRVRGNRWHPVVRRHFTSATPASHLERNTS